MFSTKDDVKTTYKCLYCGMEKFKFGDYCNMTCYYKENAPWLKK